MPDAHTVAKPNRNVKIILILIAYKQQGSRKMRVLPEIFWEEETPQKGDEFYRDKIRANKASVDDVGNGVLDVPNTRTYIDIFYV